MHEMGIAQQLVTIALDAIPDDIENPRVEKLNLRIGKLAAVVEHSLLLLPGGDHQRDSPLKVLN